MSYHKFTECCTAVVSLIHRTIVPRTLKVLSLVVLVQSRDDLGKYRGKESLFLESKFGIQGNCSEALDGFCCTQSAFSGNVCPGDLQGHCFCFHKHWEYHSFETLQVDPLWQQVGPE